MFKAVKATTVEGYLAQVPPERQEIINQMHVLIQETVPALKPHFAYNMLGYGSFKYKDYKKRDIEWPIVALANQKNYVSLYVCAIKDGEYIAEKHRADLGKVSVGKSCIRFKKLEDLNLETLKEVIRYAAKEPGLEGAKKA
jgi:uncharacterized protein YdhG (YjbR/CyaY superfamily)